MERQIHPRFIISVASRKQLAEEGVAATINQSLEKYPVASAVSFFAINNGIFITAIIGLKIAGFTAPALAFAGLIGRTTKRLRIPLHLAIAAGLAKIWPALTEVKVSRLMSPFTPTSDDNSVWHQRLQKSLDGVDKYGAAYLLASTTAGITTYALLFATIHTGVDVEGWIAWLGLSVDMEEALNETASSIAGAALFNSFCLPLRILLIPDTAKIMHHMYHDRFGKQPPG